MAKIGAGQLFHQLDVMCLVDSIFLLAVQEHSNYFDSADENVKTLNLGNGWTFIYSSANSNGKGGVGFIISPNVKTNLDGYKSIN